MKKIILFILLIVSVNIYSQVRLNYTLKSIQSEFKNYPQKIENDKLIIYDNEVIIYYYFKNKLCDKVIISTKSIIIANFLINDYTKNYQKVGNCEWKMKSSIYGYANIKLLYLQNNYNFIWTK